MRQSLALTATVLALAWAAPASAQMCGAGQTTGSTASAPAGGGMMCGMGARRRRRDRPDDRNPLALATIRARRMPVLPAHGHDGRRHGWHDGR